MANRSIVLKFIIIIIALFFTRIQTLFKKTPDPTISHIRRAYDMSPVSTHGGLLFDASKPKSPVYFLSHGGPTFMYPDAGFGSDEGAYKTISKLGKFIKSQIRPNFVVAVSGHWESHIPGTIEIAVPDVKSFKQSEELSPSENELIYDFYGFPDKMYKEQFHTENSIELSNDIKNSLEAVGIKAKLSKRGIDHGVWVPLKVAFSPNKTAGSKWNIDVPLVQVSLSKTDDFNIHAKLGEVLAKYRELGGVVICSGTSVHNLRDIDRSMATGQDMPYVAKFSNILKEVVEGSESRISRFQMFEDLKKNNRDLLYSAHPTLDHFMPLIVASSASDNEPAKELYNKNDGSLAWGIYQFGEWDA